MLSLKSIPVPRPYYIKAVGKEEGTYIRVAGTTRKADAVKIKELETQGTNLLYDEMVCIGYEVTDEAVTKLCADIKKFMFTARIKLVRPEHSTDLLSDLARQEFCKRWHGELVRSVNVTAGKI